jgi:hypothetical protein
MMSAAAPCRAVVAPARLVLIHATLQLFLVLTNHGTGARLVTRAVGTDVPARRSAHGGGGANFSCPSGHYCGSCPDGSANFDTIHLMLGDRTPGLKQFHASVRAAVAMFQRFPGIRSNDVADTHMTVQYLCCLNSTQLGTVRRILRQHPFPKLAVRFGHVICRTASFIVQADPVTQHTLGQWVAAVEGAILAAGVPVPIRRAQQAPFHSTLCTFGASYSNSSAVAMAAVNDRFGSAGFNTAPIAIDGAVLLPDGSSA